MFLRKRISLKPIVFCAIAVGLLVGSAGVAYALNSTGGLKTGGDYQIGLKQGTISNAPDVSATDYSLNYDFDASHLVSVTVTLNNTKGSAQDITLTVKVGNSAMTTTETKSVSFSCADGVSARTVTFDSSFVLTNLERIHIYIEEPH